MSITLDLPQTQRLDAEVERERSESDPDSNGGGVSSGSGRHGLCRNPFRRGSGSGHSGILRAAGVRGSVRPVSRGTRTGSGSRRAGRGFGTEAGGAGLLPRMAGRCSSGSFAKSENALALHKRLREKGYPAFVESGSSAQGAVSRVFVGPMPDRRQARDSAAKLRREMALEGIVVPYPGG